MFMFTWYLINTKHNGECPHLNSIKMVKKIKFLKNKDLKFKFNNKIQFIITKKNNISPIQMGRFL